MKEVLICRGRRTGKDVREADAETPDGRSYETSGPLLTNLPFPSLTNPVRTDHGNSVPSHPWGHQINSSDNQQKEKVYS